MEVRHHAIEQPKGERIHQKEDAVSSTHMNLQVVNFQRYEHAFACPVTLVPSCVWCTLSHACIVYKWLCFCVPYCTVLNAVQGCSILVSSPGSKHKGGGVAGMAEELETHDAGNGRRFSLLNGALLAFEVQDLKAELRRKVAAMIQNAIQGCHVNYDENENELVPDITGSCFQ